jgi:uroporphyrinogen-III synthase
MMKELQEIEQKATVFATKKMTAEQLQLFDKRMKVDSSDFIQISLNRIPTIELKQEIQNVIITSKNAVEALSASTDLSRLKFKNIYCVGRRTKKLIERKIGKVTYVASSAKNLATYLVDYIEGTEVTYFCSNIRLDELPSILTKNNITVKEVIAYETKHVPVKVPDSVKRVLFFSPSGVQSFMSENDAGIKTAYCIGETTAAEAKKHFDTVQVAKIPTVESVIELVNKRS